MLSTRKIVILALVSVLAIVSLLALLPSGGESDKLLVFYREGGIMGIREKLVVYADGKVIYTREKEGVTVEREISGEKISELKKLLSQTLIYCGKNFAAKKGAADYFTFKLEFSDCRITWVTSTVSEEPIPTTLLEVQNYLEKIITEYMLPQ